VNTPYLFPNLTLLARLREKGSGDWFILYGKRKERKSEYPLFLFKPFSLGQAKRKREWYWFILDGKRKEIKSEYPLSLFKPYSLILP